MNPYYIAPKFFDDNKRPSTASQLKELYRNDLQSIRLEMTKDIHKKVVQQYIIDLEHSRGKNVQATFRDVEVAKLFDKDFNSQKPSLVDFDSFQGRWNKDLESKIAGALTGDEANVNGLGTFCARAYKNYLEVMAKPGGAKPANWYKIAPHNSCFFKMSLGDSALGDLKKINVADVYVAFPDNAAKSGVAVVSLGQCKNFYPNHFKNVQKEAEDELNKFYVKQKSNYVSEDEFDALLEYGLMPPEFNQASEYFPHFL